MSRELFSPSFYENRRPAWREAGVGFDNEQIGAVDALSRIGMYDVELEDLVTISRGPTNLRAIMRQPTKADPTHRLFGVVSPAYALVKPIDVALAWDDSVKKSVESIDALQRGKTLFISTFLKDVDIRGDFVKVYLHLIAPMNGTESLQAFITPLRVICMNTLVAAKKLSTESLRIIHKREPLPLLREWLSSVVERTEARSSLLLELFEAFARESISPARLDYVVQKVYPVAPEPNLNVTAELAQLRQEEWEVVRDSTLRAREGVSQLFNGAGVGQATTAAQGTAWGLFNAVAEWEDYHGLRDRYRTAQRRNALFGPRAKAKQRAFSLLQGMVSVS